MFEVVTLAAFQHERTLTAHVDNIHYQPESVIGNNSICLRLAVLACCAHLN